MPLSRPRQPGYRFSAPRLLAWLPFAILVAVLTWSGATGAAPAPSAGAASYIGVRGAVTTDIFLDATNCTAASVAIGDLVPGDPWKTAQDQGGATCAVDFGTTNNVNGTSLSMLEDPAAPPVPAHAMKCTVGGCSGSSIADYDNPAAEPTAGTAAFGAQLVSRGGIANAVWNTTGVFDVQDSASPACTTTVAGTGTCRFTWGATASTATVPGAYQAQARLVVLAN